MQPARAFRLFHRNDQALMPDQRLPMGTRAVELARGGLKECLDDPFSELDAKLSCGNRNKQRP